MFKQILISNNIQLEKDFSKNNIKFQNKNDSFNQIFPAKIPMKI